MLEAVLDAGAVTALRTGAAAVIAADALARAGRGEAAVIGAGVNGACGRADIRGAGTPRWRSGISTRERARAVAAEVGGRPGSREEALAADVVVTVTPGRQVLFEAGSLQPGQHVSLLGADGPGKAEIALEELARARVVCDEREQSTHGGELAAAGCRPSAARGPGRAGRVLPARSTDAARTRRSRSSTRPGSRSRIWRSRSPRSVSRTTSTCRRSTSSRWPSSRAGSKRASSSGSSPAIAAATRLPQAKPSTFPWPE